MDALRWPPISGSVSQLQMAEKAVSPKVGTRKQAKISNKGKLIPTFWIKSSSKVISVLAQWTENYTGDIFITYIKESL